MNPQLHISSRMEPMHNDNYRRLQKKNVDTDMSVKLYGKALAQVMNNSNNTENPNFEKVNKMQSPFDYPYSKWMNSLRKFREKKTTNALEEI